MRQAINNNPIVQVAVLGGLAARRGVFFMMQHEGKEELRHEHRAPAASPAAPAT